MARCGRTVRRAFAASTIALVLLGLNGGRPALATLKYGPIELSGSVDSQTLIRTISIDQYQFIQNRNTALLRLDYDWLEKGKLVDRFEVPGVARSKLYVLYRGVYDSFWGAGTGGRQRGISREDDLIGGPISGNKIGQACTTPDCICTTPGCNTLKNGIYSSLNSEGRDALAFESTLREAYIDLTLADAPISFRVGRQQVIWGESDQFRLMDIINPLDTTWHLQQEDWDKIRIPLWLVKMIYDLGDVGGFSNTFAELVWNPGDFQPGNKVQFLPAPWAVGEPNPTRAGQVQLGSPTQPIFFTPLFNLQGTSFRQGDFTRNVADASEVGLRLHGVTDVPWINMQGLELTANWYWGRSRGIGAVAGAPFALNITKAVVPTFQQTNAFRQNPNDPSSPPATLTGVKTPIYPANVDAQFVFPYSHIFGLTGNWFEGNYTNTVFRLETAYQVSAPFQTASLKDRAQVEQALTPGGCDNGPGPTCKLLDGTYAPLGYTNKDVWAGMIGFDRPTWIKWLNPRTTWFITGQFFWSYVGNYSSKLRGSVLSASEEPYFSPTGQNPIVVSQSVRDTGRVQWANGIYAGQNERTQDATFAGGTADNFYEWEMLTTLAATSFYAGGTIVPFIAIAIDPVNRNFLSQLKLDYFLTNNFIIQGRANFYSDLGSGVNSLDPWGAGGLNARRDEVGLKVTYQF
ncbi:MAG TPA: DUF1302 family protein [Candidatus Dormibacteraeota bacterium]|nr:DUF1302 family protein [Candidatus Dormibacteraeota bacterium]